MAVVVYHFLQHLAVGHVALGQQIDFAGTGDFEFWLDAGLAFGQRLYLATQLSHCLLVLQQLTGLTSLHQVVDLQDGDVVGRTEEPRHGFEQSLVELSHLGVATRQFSQYDGILQL